MAMAILRQPVTIDASWVHPARILVATDLDDLDHLAPVALREAKRFDAELLLVHALPNFLSPSMAPSLLVYSHPEQHLQYAETRLSAITRQAADEGIRCAWETRNEDVLDAIVHTTETWKPDRLIVGSKGKSKYSLHIIGSDSERLFRAIHLPIMAVGPHIHPVWVTGTSQKILVPVSLRSDSAFLFRRAAELQTYSGASVTLLHVIEYEDTQVPGTVRLADCRAAIADRIAEPSTGGRAAHVEVKHGDVTRTILEYARDGQFDMIVMGNMSASSFTPEMVPCSAYSVVCDAPCPVLIVAEQGSLPDNRGRNRSG